MKFNFNDESFRNDYSYQNSPEAIKRFPFPFAEDQYMYSVNIEPHTKGKPGSVYEFTFDVDEHYVAECLDKIITLEQDPGRYTALPHMMDAQWDFLELAMTSLARDYPALFTLTKNGAEWTWENRPLDIMDTFTYGVQATLPCEPFEYIGRQMQGDFVLLDQRDGTLYSDAGIVTSQADWSLAFNTGMSWQEWHGPVPKVTELGVLDRALKYLLNLQVGNPVRRLNWTMTVNPRLDTSPENYPFWAIDRNKVNEETVGDLVNLRVELQSLFRLPRSNAIVFGVRCFLISLKDIATYPRWAKRLHRVQRDLHPDLIEYKGMTTYHRYVIDWLSQFDDGEVLEYGSHPE